MRSLHVRSSLFNLCNAPEKRHAVSKKGDIAFGHTMEPSSVSIVCNWPILSKNSFTSPFPWQSFSVSERGDEQHDWVVTGRGAALVQSGKPRLTPPPFTQH
ncbi:hypothetical protein EMIT093MI4_140080 [Pseudomonas sp. IT-93MI4]